MLVDTHKDALAKTTHLLYIDFRSSSKKFALGVKSNGVCKNVLLKKMLRTDYLIRNLARAKVTSFIEK